MVRSFLYRTVWSGVLSVLSGARRDLRVLFGSIFVWLSLVTVGGNYWDCFVAVGREMGQRWASQLEKLGIIASYIALALCRYLFENKTVCCDN